MVVMFLWCVQEVAGLKKEDLPNEDLSNAATFSKSELYKIIFHIVK